jgi:hypothetical protein
VGGRGCLLLLMCHPQLMWALTRELCCSMRFMAIHCFRRAVHWLGLLLDHCLCEALLLFKALLSSHPCWDVARPWAASQL